MKRLSKLAALSLLLSAGAAVESYGFDAVAATAKHIETMDVGKNDWPQWGGSPLRNNVRPESKVPISWDVKTGENIRWSMPLG